MSRPSLSPIRAQLAGHLREELSRGRWTGTMPGRDRLAEELGMNSKTLEDDHERVVYRLVRSRAEKPRQFVRLSVIYSGGVMRRLPVAD